MCYKLQHPIKKTLASNVDGRQIPREVKALSQIDKARYKNSPQHLEKMVDLVLTHLREKRNFIVKTENFQICKNNCLQEILYETFTLLIILIKLTFLGLNTEGEPTFMFY